MKMLSRSPCSLQNPQIPMLCATNFARSIASASLSAVESHDEVVSFHRDRPDLRLCPEKLYRLPDILDNLDTDRVRIIDLL